MTLLSTLKRLVLGAALIAAAASGSRADDDDDDKSLQPKSGGDKLVSTKREYVFSANGKRTIVTVNEYETGRDLSACNVYPIFLIDNSGSMSPVTTDVFTAANVAIDSLRTNISPARVGRVATVVFSNKPAVYGPLGGGRTGPLTSPPKCTFCWTQSNINEVPFPDPSTFGSQSLTNVWAAITKVGEIIEADRKYVKDNKLNELKYHVVLISDLVTTLGYTGRSSETYSLMVTYLKMFCGDDWETYLKIDGDRAEVSLTAEGRNNPNLVCAKAPATLHYLMFAMGQTGNPATILRGLKGTDKLTLEQMSTAWIQNAKSSLGPAEMKMFKIFNAGMGVTGTSGLYKSHVYPVVHEAHKPPRFDIGELIAKMMPTDCPPKTYTTRMHVAEFSAPPLPAFAADLAAISAYYGNDVRLIDTHYAEKPVKAFTPALLTPMLKSYLGAVQAYNLAMDSYRTGITSQLVELRKTKPMNLVEIEKKGKEAIDAANKAQAETRKAAWARLGKALSTVYVGGHASLRGGNEDYNKGLSTDRARALTCLYLELHKGQFLPAPVVQVGFFGDNQHCADALGAMGEDGKKCFCEASDPECKRPSSSSLMTRLSAWPGSAKAKDVQESRKALVAELETTARRAELYFDKDSAAKRGFKPTCCVKLTSSNPKSSSTTTAATTTTTTTDPCDKVRPCETKDKFSLDNCSDPKAPWGKDISASTPSVTLENSQVKATLIEIKKACGYQ